jgi:hypothetical protein
MLKISIRNRKMGYRIIQYIEELEDTTEVIRIRISKKNRQHNGQKKKYNTKGQTTIYKTLHIKLKIK